MSLPDPPTPDLPDASQGERSAPAAPPRSLSTEDRARAVWGAFRRQVAEGSMLDVMGPMWMREAKRNGVIARRKGTLIRWHYRLKPWLYPDPNPMPRRFHILSRKSSTPLELQ